MKKTLLIITLFITGVCFGQTYQLAEEFYENGLPKAIKTYKVSKGKIELVKAVSWHPNGQKREEGTYGDVGGRHGLALKDGLWTEWHSNGQKKGEETYKDGEEEGNFTWWRENGQKKEQETYKNGKRIKETTWYPNGQMSRQTTYKDGKRDGLFTSWHDNGQKKEEGTWKDGKQNGLWTEWYENGQKSSEGTYKDDERGGLWTEWYENGQKEREETYKDGILISSKCWDEDGDDNNCDEPILAALSLVQAKQLFDDGILFVDARDDVYYSKGHIQGAMKNSFLMELIFNIEERQGKDVPLVIYSSDPDNGDSEDLAYDLQDSGFTKLYVFKGGWLVWSKAGYPTK